MKIIAALLLTATTAVAGPTENITGCATAHVEGSNFTVRVDPNCALATNLDGSDDLMLVAAEMFFEAIASGEADK